MIEHTWKWAAEHGKLFTNPVNGAEYANIPVDSTKEKTRMSQQSWTLRSQATFQDRPVPALARVLQDETGGILDPDESLADDPPAAATAAGNTPPIPTVVPSLGLFFLYHLYRNLLEQEGCSGAHPVPHALADGLSVPAIGDPSCDFGQEDRWCSTRSGQAYSLTALHA